MSPANAEVVIIDDDLDMIETLREFLDIAGHSLIATVSSRDELVDLLKKKKSIFSNTGKGVFLVDGNLTPNDTSGRDGDWCVSSIKRVFPKPFPIVIGRALEKPVSGADLQMTKHEVSNFSEVARRITGL